MDDETGRGVNRARSSLRCGGRQGSPLGSDRTSQTMEPGVLAAIRAASKESGTDEITMREIDQEIAAYRREKRL
jgi:hypothetical protein